MTYHTSLDNFTKGVTIAVTVLFAGIIFSQYYMMKDNGKSIPIITTVTLLVIYAGTFIFRPISYIVTTDKLFIHRLISNVTIDKTQIKSAELINRERIRGSIRTFGVGGLFGYFGKFVNRGIGSMTWYATRRDKTVLVKTIDNRNIILTPDEPEKFVAEFIHNV